MTESQRLAGLTAAVLEGEPWHAVNIAVLLRSITAAEATARPVGGGHTIMEIVLHMTAWADEVRARLEGQPAGEPKVGDWPSDARATGTGWVEARKGLLSAYRALHETLRRQPEAMLDRPVVDPRTESGRGDSVYATAHGVIHHAVYHAGQIALLKKAIRSAAASAKKVGA